MLSFFVTVVFAAPLLMASYTDFQEMRIPNWVSAAMLAGFFLTLPFTWGGMEWFGEHMAMGGVFFVAGFAMFAFGWLGGGDAKLMSAIAIWFGWDDALLFIVYTTLIGAALALFLMLSPKVMPVRVRHSAVAEKLFQGGKNMPYGIALAGGALLVWPASQIGLALVAG